MCINFNATASGLYTATLNVDNLCNVTNSAEINIEVVAPVNVELDSQQDACLNLDYSPSPLLPGVIYDLNGTSYTESDFPLTLSNSTDPYLLTATASNRCDTLILRDTFFVFGQFNPSIVLPSQDTTICRDTSLILLSTDGLGTNWQVDNGMPLVFQDGEVYFDSDQANGDYVISFAQGFDDCEGSDSRTITIQSPMVETEGPWQFCEDGAPQELNANLDGGTWSGMGITNPVTGEYMPGDVPPGAYDVFYTFDDALTGCTVTASDQVEVVALPSAGNVPDNFSVCAVDEVLLLPDLMGIEFEPNNGIVNWSGVGIVNNESGTYIPTTAGGSTDTVSFEYTIEPACTIMDTILITIDSITPVDAGADLTICDNEENPILSATPAIVGRWIGVGIDENTGEIDLSELTTGLTYEYVYIINEGFAPCTNSDTVSVTIADGQGISVNPGEIYLCDTASILILPTGNPTSGDWGGLPQISNDTLYLSGLAPGTYPLSYTVAALPSACNTSGLTLYFNEQPTVGIESDSTGCVEVDCIPFSAQTGGAEAFLWQFGDNTGSSEAETCHSYNSTGIYSVELTGYLVDPLTDELYCVSTPATTEVEILGTMEEVEIIASNTSGCPEFTVDLSPSVIDSRYTYTWSVANIADSTTTSLSGILLPATTEDTTYLAVLTITNGCETIQDSILLTALAPFQAQVGTDFDTPCSGETVSLYNLSTGIDANNTQWFISNGIEYTGFEPPAFQVFTDTLPSTLEVMLIGSNGCNSDTTFYDIEVQPTDVRARMNYSDTEVCTSAPLEMINISTPGAPVNWVTSDGSNYQGDTVTHYFSEAGSAWVTIYATGCGFDSLQYYFEVLPPPDLSLDAEPSVCVGDESTFTIGGNAASQVLYFGNGDSTLLNVSNYMYPAPGNYTLTLHGQSAAGCRDSLMDNINVNVLPEAIVAPIDSVCAGAPVSLVSQSIGAESCVWKLSDGGTRDNCTSSYEFSGTGQQINQLVVTSPAGCKDSTDFMLYIRPTPTAAFEYEGNSECSPAEVQFTYTGGAPVPTSWQWNFGDSGQSNNSNPSQIFDFGGDYDVILMVGIDGICFDTITEPVFVRGTPRLDTLVTDERCLPSDAFVIEVDTDEENEITLTGKDYSQAGINRFEIIPPGDYELEVLNPAGCDTVLRFTVPEVFPLEVSLMPDTTILLGASIRIISEVNETGLSLEWEPTDYLDAPSLLEPTARPGETTTYVLTVSDSTNCVATDTVTIFVDEESRVYFPNAFSPNGDGKNDKYTFYPAIGVEAIGSFRIFDRWGEMVYSLKPGPDDEILHGAVETWDGELGGETMNPQVFTYMARLILTNGKERTVTGHLHLVR